MKKTLYAPSTVFTEMTATIDGEVKKFKTDVGVLLLCTTKEEAKKRGKKGCGILKFTIEEDQIL